MLSLRSVLALLPVGRQDAIKAALRKARYRAVQAVWSYSTEDLDAALRRLGVGDGDSLVMQSAFSNLNGFDGDPSHIIDCILDVIGPRGHLFMVSMPYDGSAREYLTQGKTFDVRRTPSQMGILSESFRRRRGVIRSANPLHPVLALGPRASWVVDGHERLPHSCGQGSPFEKMLALGTKALLFDVGLEVLTFTHYLEDAFQGSAPVPVYAAEPIVTDIVDGAGKLRRISVYPFSAEAMGRRNFTTLYDGLLGSGAVSSGRVGNTSLQLVPLQAVLDAGTAIVREGGHIYGTAGEPVRVKPTRPSPVAAAVAAVREEVRSGRVRRDVRALASRTLAPVLSSIRASRLPARARDEMLRDRDVPLPDDPGIAPCTSAALEWLCQAQDHSASSDGGVARDYSFVTGWNTSYAETTGYIIPTLIEVAKRTGDQQFHDRARRMLDWLVSIQLPDGGFQGGVVGATSERPVTFNTGQILLGLAAGAATFGDQRYVTAMHRAATWLVETQDDDGCWRDFPTPFATEGEKTYETHVAWGLFEAARVAPHAGYDVAAIRNVRWALTHQRSNGWFGRCCLAQPAQPLTHAIAYALRGVIEAYRYTADATFLEAATRTAESLVRVTGPQGFIPGRLRSDWTPAVSWACLTGISQIACCWLLLHEYTGNKKFLQAAMRGNAYVRRTMQLEGDAAVLGGVKGSFPVDGEYCRFELPNWAVKFTIDANLAEVDAQRRLEVEAESQATAASDDRAGTVRRTA